MMDSEGSDAKRAKRGDSSDKVNDKKRTRATVPEALEFVRKLAVNPTEKLLDPSLERTEICNLRDGLFSGPSQAKKRPIQKKLDRPCSPTVMSYVADLKKKDWVTNKATKQKNPQEELDQQLALVRSHHYSADPKDVNGASLKLKTSKCLLLNSNKVSFECCLQLLVV
mmetsp:Transcript_14985/g.26252  ORF Transcript_14985/g.26252 Transcript_14985/m.26252 type:complete len:168 (+) Transcript_14985:318-821(+)